LEGNTKIDHKEISWEGMVWINLAQDKGMWCELCEHGKEV
jgi:hypothetical protein